MDGQTIDQRAHSDHVSASEWPIRAAAAGCIAAILGVAAWGTLAPRVTFLGAGGAILRTDLYGEAVIAAAITGMGLAALIDGVVVMVVAGAVKVRGLHWRAPRGAPLRLIATAVAASGVAIALVVRTGVWMIGVLETDTGSFIVEPANAARWAIATVALMTCSAVLASLGARWWLESEDEQRAARDGSRS